MSLAAADLRRWVRELRSLVVTITPPALHAQGLGAALADLASTLEGRGIDVTVDVEDVDGIDEASETLLYRAAQEAVRNIAKHAEATEVTLTVARRTEPTGRSEQLVLTVRDDGRGFDAVAHSPRRHGSVGLELLTGLVASQGGAMRVDAEPGSGTTLVVQLPVTGTDRAPEPATV
jgi:signal transduction histidine kinase